MNPFRELMVDRVTLVKRDGRRFPNLPAAVSGKGKILTDDPNLPIEDGDEFERVLPSGVLERYIIRDAGFHPEFHGMPAGYESEVMKSTAPTPVLQPHVVYNLVGPNTRVNIQSVDSSTNVGNVDSHQMTAARERSWITESYRESRRATELSQATAACS